MPGWPWKKKDTAGPSPDQPAVPPLRVDAPPAARPAVAITAAGDRAVAAAVIQGDVYTGEVRAVHLARGVIQPSDGIAVPAPGVHNLPRRPSPVFVGRDDLMAQVAGLFAPPAGKTLTGGARAAVGQAITGLGGIGKSELALQYAHRRTGPGAVVWWADAENAQTLELGLADLGYRLQPRAAAEEWTTPQAAAWAVGWLQAHTGWLLVLDNVEDPDLIAGLLGHLTAGDILITTRRRIPWGKHGVTPLTLEVLPRPAAVRLLHDTVLATCRDLDAALPDGLDSDVPNAIADELGDLPLALEQAAAYLAAHQTALTDYLQRLRNQPTTILGSTAPGTAPQRAVARVFALTVTALIAQHPAAVDILRALAWLAPVPLPRQVITRPGGTEHEGAGTAAVEADELLALLASYSLISLTPTTVAVHRLLQATVRDHDRITSDQDDAAGLTGAQETAVAWLSDAVPTDPAVNLAGWGLWRDLLPHLQAMFDHLPDLPDRGLGRLLHEAAIFVAAQGRHDSALPLRQRALAITEAALGPDHPDTANVLDNLATTLGDLGRHADALALRERALAVTEAALGPDHPDTAARLDNLAATLGDLGRHADALPLRQRALAITEAALGPDDPTTALRKANLGYTFWALGRHTDALPLEQGALTVTEATLGPNHPQTAARLDNLATTLATLGRHADALPLQQRALTITEDTLGPDHPHTAVRLNNLAYTLSALGRHTDALPLQQRALAITEAALGPAHPSSVTLLKNLTQTLAALGQDTDAVAVREGFCSPPPPAGDRGSGRSGP
jgi:tetratricopeptide (TPR) repeat protein